MLWLLSAILPLSMLMLTTPTHMIRGGRSLWRKEKRWPCLSVSLLVSCSTWKQQRGGTSKPALQWTYWARCPCRPVNVHSPCHAPHYEGARPHLAPCTNDVWRTLLPFGWNRATDRDAHADLTSCNNGHNVPHHAHNLMLPCGEAKSNGLKAFSLEWVHLSTFTYAECLSVSVRLTDRNVCFRR